MENHQIVNNDASYMGTLAYMGLTPSPRGSGSDPPLNRNMYYSPGAPAQIDLRFPGPPSKSKKTGLLKEKLTKIELN